MAYSHRATKPAGGPVVATLVGTKALPAAVVGVDGLGGFAARLLGAASTDVVRTACVPVIVARQH